MAINSLTAIERETIITMNDEEDYMAIHTEQKPMITALKKNPSATLIEEGKFGSSAWAKFEVPAYLLTIRKGKKTVSSNAKNNLKKALANVPKCNAITVAGKPCQGKSINGTGRCYKHQEDNG